MTHAFNLIAGLEAAFVAAAIVLYIVVIGMIACHVGNWIERRTGQEWAFISTVILGYGSSVAFIIVGFAR